MRRTGTTLCAELIEEAFGIKGFAKNPRPSDPEGKHSLVKPRAWSPTTALVINIKDPYAWLVSIHAWDVVACAQGSRTPKSNPPVTFGEQDVRRLIAGFNKHYANWLALPYYKAVIRYEDMLQNLSVVYDIVTDLLGMPPDPGCVRISTPATVVLPRGRGGKKKTDRKFNKDYYLQKRYLAKLSREQTEQITAEVDWKLLNGLYTPLGATDDQK